MLDETDYNNPTELRLMHSAGAPISLQGPERIGRMFNVRNFNRHADFW